MTDTHTAQRRAWLKREHRRPLPTSLRVAAGIGACLLLTIPHPVAIVPGIALVLVALWGGK